MNKEFLHHFCTPFAGPLVTSGRWLVSIVENQISPIYPNIDVVGFSAYGKDIVHEGSSSETNRNSTIESISSKLLEEAGIAINAEELLDDDICPIPPGLSRFVHVPSGIVSRKPLTIVVSCVPSGWRAIEDVIGSDGRPSQLPSVIAKQMHIGYSCRLVLP